MTCYLLSHINGLTSESAQIILLKTIATITNKAKYQMILPTVQSIVEKASAVPPAFGHEPASESLVINILACFDTSAAEYLNETATGWDVFLQLIRTYLRSGKDLNYLRWSHYQRKPGTSLSLQQSIAHALEGGLFSALNQPRKVSICENLLEVGSRDTSAVCVHDLHFSDQNINSSASNPWPGPFSPTCWQRCLLSLTCWTR